MKIFYTISLIILVSITPLYVFGFQNVTEADTTEVIKLNQKAYKARLSDAVQTVSLGKQALEIARKIPYTNGIAEAYRTIGIGYAYQYEQAKAFENYLNALTFYQGVNNKRGEAKVDNNIGNLYRDNDPDIALTYFNQALKIAVRLNDAPLIASLYLNQGNVYLRKKDFYNALFLFEKSQVMFEKQHDTLNVVNCLQNAGVTYFRLKEFAKAEKLLMQAHESAKQQDLTTMVASIDLTLASLFIAQEQFKKAETFIQEGSSLPTNKKVIADYQYTNYELYYKQKNYERALAYLSEIYRRDSVESKNVVSARIALMEKKHAQDRNLQLQQTQLLEQKNIRYLSIGVSIAALLLIVVIILLVANVKRKNETNKQLTDLNNEVSKQKDDLDRINHHLEEIIDERTKDLQIKNKKLSEYSSYLSHQIRGPIATLKGLMNLEKEGLVDKSECIVMMDKCVSEIDEKIIDMSDMLHDPGRTTIKLK